MGTVTSKAERIRKMLAKDIPNARIAKTVGCGDAYVRSVKQRLEALKKTGRQLCDADKNYLIRKYGSINAGYNAFNELNKPYRTEYYRLRATRPVEVRRAAARKAAKTARETRA